MSGRIASIEPLLARIGAPPRDRYDAGRALRESVPLEAHAALNPDGKRAPPLAILTRQDKKRLPDLVPLRYGRMSRTPFTFLRGAAAVMASDLAAMPRTDLLVELCGDAHLGNFRLYSAPDRRLVFDLNDFDETLPGPFEWDVKRLAASVMVCARNNGHSKKDCRAATRAAVCSYRAFIAEAAALSPLELYYYRFEADAVLERVQRSGKKARKWKEAVIGKAVRKNSMQALNKLTAVVEGRRRIIDDPPLIVRAGDRLLSEELAKSAAFYEKYRETLTLDRQVLIDQFSLVDVARKVVGVGSVGTHCMVLLLEAGDGTPLFLQLKQAVASVLEPHLGKSAFKHAGQRVVMGQRLIQATSDVFLGWARWADAKGPGIDFYVRQLWDGKGKIDVEDMSPARLALYAGLCGKTLAFAHARSGDPVMISGYLGDDDKFDDCLVHFADRYADCNARDHAQLCAAIDSSEIAVIRDI